MARCRVKYHKNGTDVIDALMDRMVNPRGINTSETVTDARRVRPGVIPGWVGNDEMDHACPWWYAMRTLKLSQTSMYPIWRDTLPH